MTFFYKNDIQIYISKVGQASADSSNTVQLNVKDFSYNRTNRTELIARSTLDPNEERIINPVVSQLSPVSFSFTTYIQPLVDTNVTSPEENLWVGLLGVDTITSNSSPTSSLIDFADGNLPELQNLTLWFYQPTNSEGNFRIDNAVIDAVEIDLEIGRIAELRWFGRALSITEDNTPPAATDRTQQTNFIKNKLTTISLDMNSVSYTLALTGGRVRIDNNNQYYGRSKLGEITVPTGHYSGKREISGDLNFYFKTGTNTGVDFFTTLLSNIESAGYEDTYFGDITINVGGVDAPNMVVDLPEVIFDFPQKVFDNVISMRVPFVTKESAGNYAFVEYRA